MMMELEGNASEEGTPSSPEETERLEFLRNFECPVCYEFILPPIHQCREGHIICNQCLQKLPKNICPTCRCNLGETPIRNLVLEKIARGLEFPCKNADKGCNALLKLDAKGKHQKLCRFRVPADHSCPLAFETSNCSFEGSFGEIEEHLKQLHGVPAAVNAGDQWLEFNVGRRACEFENMEGLFDLHLIKSEDELFLLICRLFDVGGSRSMFRQYEYRITIQLIGAPEKVANFIFRCEVRSGRRQASWDGVPLPITDKAIDAFDCGDCFVLHHRTAALLGYVQGHDSGEGGMTVRVFIGKPRVGEEEDADGEVEDLDLDDFNFRNTTIARHLTLFG